MSRLATRAQTTGPTVFSCVSPRPGVAGPRTWDLAEAAYRFVPLTGPDNPDVGCSGVAEQARRLALFCAEYGDVGPAHETGRVDRGLRRAGDPVQQAVLERGDVAIYQHDIAHLDTHRHLLA